VFCSKSLRYIITVLLPVFLLMPGRTLGAVLCIKANGHIAVEADHKGRCAPLSTPVAVHSDEHTITILPSTDTCGPCIDVPLLSNREDWQILSAPSSLSQLTTPVFALVPCVPLVYAELSLRDFVLQPPARAGTLLALRTVVLLL
jgi:hypothetical protein